MLGFATLCAAALVVVTAYALRFAYRAGRSDREVEARIRADIGARYENLLTRVALLETEDATRRRQIHDLTEEFEGTVGPTHHERTARLLDETATATATKTQQQRYGLGPVARG